MKVKAKVKQTGEPVVITCVIYGLCRCVMTDKNTNTRTVKKFRLSELEIVQ